MKPIVGIIPLFDEEKNSIWMIPGYMEGIRQAGGIPIILPLKAQEDELLQICDMCSGFLFTGGQDVEPAVYGAKRSESCGQPNHDRDTLEKRIFAYALERDKPVFGICRGIQLINALLGGTLYQDLPTEYKGTKNVEHHMKPPYDVPCHQVTVLENTPLSRLLGKSTLQVNSYHHQAVKTLAGELRAMAISEDGLIEAVYLPGKKFVQAVQWHPELIYLADKDAGKLFESFVEACRSVL